MKESELIRILRQMEIEKRDKLDEAIDRMALKIEELEKKEKEISK